MRTFVLAGIAGAVLSAATARQAEAGDDSCIVGSAAANCTVNMPEGQSEFTLDFGGVSLDPTCAIDGNWSNAAGGPTVKVHCTADSGKGQGNAKCAANGPVGKGIAKLVPSACGKLTKPLTVCINNGCDKHDDPNRDTAGTPIPRPLPADVWARALTERGFPTAGHPVGNYYDRSNDRAVIFVSAAGVLLYPIPDTIDEDDDIYIAFADTGPNLDDATFLVQNCDRPPIAPRVFRGTPEATGAAGKRQQQGEPVEVRIIAIGKCKGNDSGGPKIVLSGANPASTITVPVNPLYRFAIGAAIAADFTTQSRLGLVAPPGQTITRITETNEPLGLSSLIFVSMYLAPRDFRKTDLFLAQRTQLFLGLDPRAFDSFVVIGAGYELVPGLNLLAGWRALVREKVLAAGSGLQAGSTFGGTESTLPTQDHWKTGSVFLGLGLDTHLAARLLK